MLDKLPYELVPVPGMEDMKVLVVSESTNQYWNNPAGSKAPWWMVYIQVDDKAVLTSTVKGDTDSAQLYGFHIESSRTTNPDIGNQLFTSAMIRHEDCILVIPNGGYVAALENYMYKGTCIEKVSLMCYGWIKGKRQLYQSITMMDPYITSITHNLDRVFVRLRVNEKVHKFTTFTQTGTPKGSAVCRLHLQKNTNALA